MALPLRRRYTRSAVWAVAVASALGCRPSTPTSRASYAIYEREDVSFAGAKRLVIRANVAGDSLPSELALVNSAQHTWQTEGREYDEFTVAFFLAGNPKVAMTYGSAEFRRDGLKGFRIDTNAVVIQRMARKKSDSVATRSKP